jgi:hypothetical protein
MQKEAAIVHILAVKDARGMRQAKLIRKTYEKLHKCLHNLCDDPNEQRKDFLQFLQAVSHQSLVIFTLENFGGVTLDRK